jgi:hypothetical protein
MYFFPFHATSIMLQSVVVKASLQTETIVSDRSAGLNQYVHYHGPCWNG